MNKLQIIEQIFGTLCFTPYLRVCGDKEYMSAKAKLHYFNDWSPISVGVFKRNAEELGYGLGVDFDRKEFTLHPKN